MENSHSLFKISTADLHISKWINTDLSGKNRVKCRVDAIYSKFKDIKATLDIVYGNIFALYIICMELITSK